MEKKFNTSIFSTPTEASTTEPLIEITNLRQVFNEGTDKEYKLFDGFYLTIPDKPGQVISIMGGSGCGKSCLLKAIAGLTTVPEGEIKIKGNPTEIPMVFQSYSNYEWMTILDNVMLPMLIDKVPKKEAEEKAVQLLKLVGLENHLHKYAKSSNLSGGQLQRVSIARSLACNSNIILLDEATSALDIKMKREVQNIILKIKETSNITFINVTHNIEEAVYLSDKIIILKPNPCTISSILDLGPRTPNSPEFIRYMQEVTLNLEKVCL